MKATIIGILVVVMMAVALAFRNSEPVTYVKEQVEVQEPQPEEIVEEDTIEKARQELERINAELDAEEQKLLDEIKEREVRIEKIRETRMSFQ